MICVLFENEEWIAPLRELLGDKVSAWNFADSELDLSSIPEADVYFNKLSASAFSRGHCSAPILGASIVQWLEANDRKIVNGSNSVSLELSKAYQLIRLRANNLRTPETRCFNSLDTLKVELLNVSYPVIVKPNCGGKGLGVVKISSREDVNSLELHSEDGLYLLQRYVEPADGSITRMEFIAGKFVYAVKVDTTGGFERCPADACEVGVSPFSIIPNFDHPLIAEVQSFLSAEKVDVAGVEFVTNASGESFIYDINTSTNYNTAAEKAVGISAFSILANYLSEISS